MQRRSFLKGLGSAAVALPMASGFGGMRAWAQAPLDAPFRRLRSANDQNVLVIVRFFGGNDGINTLVPLHDDRYYHARGRGTVNDLSVPAETVVPLAGHNTLGFHPAWAPLAELFNEGKMVAVQNVGYPNPNMSHFRSSDIWFSASDSDAFETSGWYGRYLEEKYPQYPSVLPGDPFAVELDTALGMTLIGRHHEMGLAVDDLSYIPDEAVVREPQNTEATTEQQYIAENLREANTFMRSISDAELRQPANRVVYPTEGPLPRALARVARLVAAGLRTQVYIINVDGFDTHDGHIRRHAILLKYCADALHAFQRDLEAFGVDDRVATMTVSEFGRRVAPSGTGTDHGAAAPMFLMGRNVKPGIIGQDPDFDDLDETGNLKMQFDFRQIYASVLKQWFAAADEDIYPNALPRAFSTLPIFRVEASDGPLIAATGSLMELRSVSPNPASVSATVAFENVPPGAGARLRLTTMEGRTVLDVALPSGSGQYPIDLRGVPSGVYLCTLVTATEQRTARLVVRR